MRAATLLARDVREGRTEAQALVQEALTRAEVAFERLNAFITLAPERALSRARAVDAAVSAGEALPLAGVPLVVKDNILTEGLKTTAASVSLADFVAPYSATVIERLERAGAVVIGKTNLDEFAMGSSNENSAFGPVRNPWDESRVPGGSSGGTAAAVAAGVTPVGLGTDTGGSVREPASFCGLIGFKPTYGRLSRYGLIAFASSLEQVGIVCLHTGDLALLMEVMCGYDPRDATSIPDDRPAFLTALDGRADLGGLRVGIIAELLDAGNTAGVMAGVDRMIRRLGELGAEVDAVSLPHARYGLASYYLVAPAEASANLARFDGMIYSLKKGEDRAGQAAVMKASRGEGFGPEVRRRVLMGTYALSSGYYQAYYEKALKVRRLLAGDVEAAFSEVDVLLSPTTPTTAYRLGEKTDDPLAMYMGDIDTVLANLLGLPAVSLPSGLDQDGLPCGVQLIAPPLKDELLITVTAALERLENGPLAGPAPGWPPPA